MSAEELARLLDELGRRLGPAGEYVFALAVRQVVIESVVWGLTSVVVLIGYGLLVRAAVKRSRGHGDLLDDPLGFPIMIGLLLGVFAAIFGVFGVGSAIVNLLNPEFAAIARLLGQVPR